VVTITKARNQKGFTLIELILATSILMMVLFTGYYAYSLYNTKWQQRVNLYWQETKDGIAIDSIQKLISATALYSVVSDNNIKELVFSGDNTNVMFVSGEPILAQNKALVRLEIVKFYDKYKIIYKEKDLLNYTLIGTQLLRNVELLDWTYEAVLIDNLDEASFRYFGWQSFDDALKRLNLTESIQTSTLFPTWYTEHNASRVRTLPHLVNIRLKSNNKVTDFKVRLPENSVYTLLANSKKDSE